MHKNVTILKTITLHLLKFSPNTIMLMISNLVNAFNFVSENLFRFLHNWVTEYGTNLYSFRFH
jgi:malate/lactate dehydrogenase